MSIDTVCRHQCGDGLRCSGGVPQLRNAFLALTELMCHARCRYLVTGDPPWRTRPTGSHHHKQPKGITSSQVGQPANHSHGHNRATVACLCTCPPCYDVCLPLGAVGAAPPLCSVCVTADERLAGNFAVGPQLRDTCVPLVRGWAPHRPLITGSTWPQWHFSMQDTSM